MKIVVVGLGYVGLSNAVLLAQHNEVIGVDISQGRVDALNARKSPIIDAELSKYLVEKNLNLSASTDLKASLDGADYVIVSTPTNYDEQTKFFDTVSVESVISTVIKSEPSTCVIVKSTIPVGFIEDVRDRLNTDAVIFSPEFLREGQALYDNLYPSRIIVGERSKRAAIFSNLLAQGALKPNIEILLTGAREAEAIKLFSNTYLAMRVAFFNELDSYSLASDIDSSELIKGVSLDPRVGDYYNNPSFGYGGYCLPKDTKQLLVNFKNVPQDLILATVKANSTRKRFMADRIIAKCPKRVGIYRLIMKADSDNFRHSSIFDIIQILQNHDIEVVVYEPNVSSDTYQGMDVITELTEFATSVDVIIANRTSSELANYKDKVFTRDINGKN